ncbi:MAG: InlB B-repeat-containing protein [Bacteroidales bacterium]|nr:InlB B-repeat-containing protein [Bacteroidales bacterium]
MKLHVKHFCTTTIAVLFLILNAVADPDLFTVTVTGGNSFKISRTDASAASYVYYYTQSGSAVADIHYNDVSGTLEFPEGIREKTITISSRTVSDGDKYVSSSRSRDFYFVVYNNSMTPLYTNGYVSGWTNYSYSSEKQQKIFPGGFTADDHLRTHDGVVALAEAFTDDDRSYFTNTNQKPKYKFNVSFQTYEVVDGYYYMGIYFNSNSSDPWKTHKVAATPSGKDANLYNVCWERSGRAGTTFTIKLPIRNLSSNGNINSYVWNSSTYWNISNTNDYLYSQYFNSYYSNTWSGSDGYFISADGTEKVSIATNASGDDDDEFYVGSPVTNVKLWDDAAPIIKGISMNTAHTYSSGERVYMAVRFNEVVDHHVTNATVSIGSNTYTFTYAGGDYTTTLYFYCDNITTTSTSGITGTVTLKSIGGYVNDMNGNTKSSMSGLSYTVTGFKMYPSYAVTLNTNGGIINGGNVTKYTYKVGATLPTNVTRPGYTFGGWYTNSACTGSAVTAISTTVSGAKTYYAKWTPITYTISYNLAGGAQVNPVTSYTVETPTFTLVNPTRTGYTFVGWKGSNGTSAQTSVSIAKGSTGDKTYTANWNANKYYIVYNGSGNTSGTMSNTTCTYDVSATLRNNAFVKTGYTFLGWATTASASSAIYTNQQSVTNLTSTSGATINLYAVWSAKKYTVTLNQTEASVEGTATVEATYNIALPVITPPIRIGYGFEGFFTQQNGEGNQYYKSDGVPSVTSYQYDGNLILYAKWTERDYTITYYNDGGTITTENPTTSYSYGTTVTLPSIQKNGCTFDGWYDNPNFTGDEITQISSTEYGDKIFYAKWNPITYNVTLNKNNGEIKSGNVTTYVFGIGAILPTAQNMERDGFTFAGWYDNEEFEGDAINAITVADYEDKVFWAKWEEGGYVVTLQTNGGTINSGNIVSYKYLTGAILPTYVTKTGYTFTGWYENSSCLGTPVTEIPATATGDKTYWAKWTENVYAVTFHENEGTINNNVVVETYTFTVGAALPTDVTRKGYSFGGWFNNEQCTGNPVTLISTTEYDDKEFWADWNIVTYSITFNNNGGLFENQGIPETYQLGDKVVLPTDISREGYTFDGWYDNSNFTNTKVTTIEDDEVGNKVFYAKWLVNSYNITLETNGGTINSGNVTNYTYGYGISLPSDVTKLGYSFAGWYADEEFATARLTRISETVSGNQTFYAKWTENTYSITLNVNEGSINEEYMSYYTFGTSTSLPTDVTRQGYTFMGWFVNSNFDGSTVESVSATEYGDKAYWAKWQVEKYDVTLQTNGGTINSGNLSGYSFGVGAVLPTDITKVGHTFAGWYASEEFNSAELSVIAVNETGDKTFYAKWTVDDYPIIYNTNGGTINDEEIHSYTYGAGAELPSDVSRVGYTFAGWYTNDSYSGLTVSSIQPNETGNKTFYAKWDVNSYSVTLEPNGGTINSGNVTNYMYSSNVILPTDVTRQGYVFAGWHIDEQELGYEESNSIVQILSTDIGDKTYYAWWTKNTYTITYFTEQGAINDEEFAESYTFGEGATLPTNVTREGYTFAGWFSNSSYAGASVQSIPATDFGNKSFYAKWNANMYTVTFVTNDGTINSGKIENYTYGNATLLPSDVTKDGFTFAGWYTDKDCSGERIPLISNTDIDNKIYYANWVIVDYTITYNNKGGVINGDFAVGYNIGDETTLPTDVTRTGYDFAGWYDNSNYDNEPVTSISATETGNKELWAKWNRKSYTVTVSYDKAMGTISGSDSYLHGDNAVLKARADNGFEFASWNCDDENVLKDKNIQDSTLSIVVTNPVELTATFKLKEIVYPAAEFVIGTVKTETEIAPIDLATLFETNEGGELSYLVTSSAPNILLAQIEDGKLYLSTMGLQGKATITVTAKLANGNKTSLSAEAVVEYNCDIQVDATITDASCYGFEDGSISLSSEKEYSYQWISEDNSTNKLENIKAGNYSVQISDARGCKTIETFTVSQPDEVVAEIAGFRKPKCDAADGEITVSAESEYDYLWSNGATSKNLTEVGVGDYTVTVTDPANGCSITLAQTIEYPANPVITVEAVEKTRCDQSAGAVIVSVDNEVLYNWTSAGETISTEQNLTNVSAGIYTLTVTDGNNCVSTETVEVKNFEVQVPQISLVTVSKETGKNLIVWVRENTDLIDYYTIYREDSESNDFNKIGTVQYSEISVFEDEDANPMNRQWSYKITATDICGNETAMSEAHTTLHLGQSESLRDGYAELNWDPYVGVDYRSFYIIRETTVNNYTFIDTVSTVPASLTSYTAEIPTVGKSIYYVGIKLNELIDPKDFMKAESGPFSLALSNIAEAENNVAVSDVNNTIHAYSAHKTIVIENAGDNQITICNAVGQTIARTKGGNELQKTFAVEAGIYIVIVGNKTFKIAVD